MYQWRRLSPPHIKPSYAASRLSKRIEKLTCFENPNTNNGVSAQKHRTPHRQAPHTTAAYYAANLDSIVSVMYHCLRLSPPHIKPSYAASRLSKHIEKLTCFENPSTNNGVSAQKHRTPHRQAPHTTTAYYAANLTVLCPSCISDVDSPHHISNHHMLPADYQNV